MGISKHIVRALVGLMAIAIVGILFLQYRLLRNNVELKEESFGRNAVAALNAAASRVEEADVRERIFTPAADSANPIVMRFNRRDALPGGGPPDTMIFVAVMSSEKGTLSARLNGTQLSYRINGQQHVSIRVFDELGRLDTTLLDERKQTGGYDLVLPKERLGKGVRFIQIRADSATSTIRWEGGKTFSYRFKDDEETRAARIIGRVAETVTAGRIIPLSERLRPGLLDSAIAEGLAAGGITLPYRFAVRDVETDSVVLGGMDPDTTLPRRTYSALLFPAGFSGHPGELLLWFPGYRSHLVQSILPELLLNLLFVLLVAACFWYALRTLRRQREFAGRLSDFINNMTHEFKTPLSTIALSTEALARPDVLEDRAKLEMYGTIISDEQKRMKSQVDRILEMAALEEGEFEFKQDLLDIHEIAAKAAANSALRVKERGGTLATDFRAEALAVRGDAVHIGSAINSVLDNAEKYSPGAPEIRVSTYNADGWVVVSVADRGIGIAPEHLPDIFEKYYRVPTNNLHDVKGFGIGLSYVKLVVERHGGQVRVTSAPGEGTTIELRFRNAGADDGR